jgi:D-alanyl-D-alanine carboxypeptidase
MTCILAIKILERLNLDAKKILKTITKKSANLIGTTANIKSGDRFKYFIINSIISIYDLFFGMMLPSGNDAAESIAEYFGKILYLEDND